MSEQGQENRNDESLMDSSRADSSSTVNMQAFVPYVILAAIFLVAIGVNHADNAANRAENAATLRVMHDDAMAAGEAKADAKNALAHAEDARMEARVLQDKVESLRLEIAKGKGKP